MKVVVIGGSAAGMSFAAKYKRNQPSDEVIVLDKRSYISFGACGLPYFAGGMFDDTERMISRTPEQAIKSGLDVRVETEMVSFDRTEKQITVRHQNQESVIDYDMLVIATGARPIVPSFGEFNPEHVYTLTSMEDGLAVKEALKNASKQRVCVIGAGFIGLEFFDAAHGLDKRVTIIEREQHIMSRQFSPEIIEVVEGAIRESGAELKTGCSVSAIRDAEQGGYIVETDNGNVEADVVILSLGFKPNTEAFELPKAANGALLVNEYGATEDAYINAVGDCAVVHHMALGKPVYVPLATTANKQARMMADKLAGKDTYMSGFLGSSCLKVLDYELACTGVNETLAKEHCLDVKVSTISDKNQTDYYPGQEDIKVKLVYHPETNVLLGGEIVGKKGAVGRINALAVAITAKMTTQQLGYMDFCYAPPFSRTWDALNVAGNVAK
ncbi:CoA-disulfide reductase [Vibrio splendidus]|uniref:CoA-disulfide reductase n=1 Tax=Vibrio splendidus TaxID=29497 RepID=A0A2N7CHL5_VIBSP|nr:CoA-disulfide reductase [Vibrio splendidus]MDP2490628.1 CoA-disulfide reductase [Vibrio splendidus]PMF26217.1 CoA-disulfide reductase [Vibrio splendidus]PMO55667.1 CoA-disulfide reductase [Vibrio splendidus]